MYPRPMLRYMAAIEALAALILLYGAWRVGSRIGQDWVNLVVLMVMTLVTSLFTVRFIRGNGMVSVQLPVLFASAIILGPWLGAWLGMLATVNWREMSGKVKMPSIVFNRAQFALIAWTSATLFELFGGSVRHLALASMSLPLAVSAIVAFFLNMVLVMIALKFRLGRPLTEIWRVHFKWMTFNFWAMLPIGYLMAAVYQSAGVWPEFLFLIPLGLTRWIFVLFHVVRRFYQNTVQVLMTAMDAKDPYTRGHSMRVARYAKLLAEAMGLSEDQVEEIERAAALHDVGKLAVPDPILNKPGRLTADELLVIQRHPLLGGAMLNQIEGIGCARDWVLHHHERWDGQGYPHQLVGAGIPLASRIIAVVDAYDAMTSDRPYRQALRHEDACRELAESSGSQLDPVVVHAFLKLAEGTDLADRESLGRDFNQVFPGDNTRAASL